MGAGPRKLARLGARADALVVGSAVVPAYLVAVAPPTAAGNGLTRHAARLLVPATLNPRPDEKAEGEQRPERAGAQFRQATCELAKRSGEYRAVNGKPPKSSTFAAGRPGEKPLGDRVRNENRSKVVHGPGEGHSDTFHAPTDRPAR
jgi:hypothetical protein